MQWMLRIRKARREDARSIGACHYHCWQETYSGLISDEYLEAMNEAQNMERFEGLYLQTGRYQYVVLDGSQIVGFLIYPRRGRSMLLMKSKACIYESRITDMDTAEPSWTI